LIGKPERKRPLGRPWRRWEYNIKIYDKRVGFEDVDWIYMAQDRDRLRSVVNPVINIRVPKVAGIF
jgi:hypothetical protein